ncbi:glutathione S-transferase kappa 1 [Natator depressus]|uniref:glutathione S-transferase kappa 1 n=1 Tax=Natator depressus TaxID=27790 RepID=UPI003EBF8D7E
MPSWVRVLNNCKAREPLVAPSDPTVFAKVAPTSKPVASPARDHGRVEGPSSPGTRSLRGGAHGRRQREPLQGPGRAASRGQQRPAAARRGECHAVWSRLNKRPRPEAATGLERAGRRDRSRPSRGCGAERRPRGAGQWRRQQGEALAAARKWWKSSTTWCLRIPGSGSRYRHNWSIELCFRPAFLGGIMKETGNQPPAMVPKRGEYMMKDIKRMAKYTTSHCSSPRTSLEVLSEKDEDITQPESILAAAGEAGLPSALAQKLLAMTSTPEVKNRLKATTEEALNYGAFGMPALVAHVNGESHLFFGSDRLELLGNVIGEKWLGPVPAASKPRI